MAGEIWKDVPGYEGLYRVSDHGSVKSLVMWNGWKYVERKEPKEVGWIQDNNGYKRRCATLTNYGEKHTFKVHQIVAIAFIPNDMNRSIINHKDGNPLNNHRDNLEWCTQKENVDHAVLTGLVKVNAYGQEERVVELYDSGMGVREICKVIKSGRPVIERILMERFGEIRGIDFYHNKYHIDMESLIDDFSRERSNQVLAAKYNTNTTLIATYRYQHKQGER